MLNVADLRAQLSNAIPTCRVYHNTTQVVASDVVLAFNSERYDRWGMHDNVTNNSRITIIVPGVYDIGTLLQANTDVLGYSFINARILKNGTDFISSGISNPVDPNIGPRSASFCNARLTKGDYVEVECIYLRNSGGDATFQTSDTTTNQHKTEFWATWIAGY